MMAARLEVASMLTKSICTHCVQGLNARMKKKVPNRKAGGIARAKKMNKKQLSEQGKRAASARWAKEKGVPQATHSGELQIGDIVIECHVLEDGTRVLTQQGLYKSLGRAGNPKTNAETRGISNLPVFLQGKSLQPFINEDVKALSDPVKFRIAQGGQALGFKADLLPHICNICLDARDAGALHYSQNTMAERCKILSRGLAVVGITALVDEATGYQEVRDRLALQKILDRYLTDEWAKWTKTFPDEFYRNLFRLKGIEYPPASGKKPSYVGHWTNDIVYSRLAPGVLKELRKKNPRNESGNRSRRHHQHLTRDYGHPVLQEHLSNVIFLMKGCSTWGDFKTRLDAAKAKFGDTMQLPLDN